MLTKQFAVDTAKHFTTELILNGIKLDKVLLFGSYVRDEQDQDSDIDIALYSSSFTGYGYKDRQSFALINAKKEFIDIETKTFSTNTIDPFSELVEQTGIEIYNVNNEN